MYEKSTNKSTDLMLNGENAFVELRPFRGQHTISILVKKAQNILQTSLSTPGNEIGVSIAAGEAVRPDVPEYDGPYELTPKASSQTMETSGKLMSQDVVILEIPLYETSNDYGTTLNIGG